MNTGKGQTVMIVGIISLFCFGIILGPVAWVMGNNVLRESGDEAEKNQANIGRICGIVATILNILGILFYILVFAGLFAMGATQAAPRLGS